MSLAVRAAAEAAALAFALTALATSAFYFLVLSAHASSVWTPAIALALVAFAFVFLTVLVLVNRRISGKRPVLGARRGAVIGVLTVVVVASAHACVTFGAAGLVYSLLGQVGYACLLGGLPSAVIGAVCGHLIEKRALLNGAP